MSRFVHQLTTIRVGHGISTHGGEVMYRRGSFINPLPPAVSNDAKIALGLSRPRFAVCWETRFRPQLDFDLGNTVFDKDGVTLVALRKTLTFS